MTNQLKIYLLTLLSFFVGTSQFIIAGVLDKIADIGLVIYLEVSDNTIRERIIERGKTSGREDDQSIDIINRRILQYKLETKPLVDFYGSKKILATIDGEESINEVFNRVENIIKLWK